MVTRRAILKGTAAGSIAAIASAHGVAAYADSPKSGPAPIPIPYPNTGGAPGVGYGNFEGGALGAFQKLPDGFSVFFKFYKTSAELFYMEDANRGAVDIFFKFFHKAWEPFLKIYTRENINLQGAAAGFSKLESDVAKIFLKFNDNSFHYLNVHANGEYDEPEPDNGPIVC